MGKPRACIPRNDSTGPDAEVGPQEHQIVVAIDYGAYHVCRVHLTLDPIYSVNNRNLTGIRLPVMSYLASVIQEGTSQLSSRN